MYSVSANENQLTNVITCVSIQNKRKVVNGLKSLDMERTYTNITPCSLHSAEEKLHTYFETK